MQIADGTQQAAAVDQNRQYLVKQLQHVPAAAYTLAVASASGGNLGTGGTALGVLTTTSRGLGSRNASCGDDDGVPHV